MKECSGKKVLIVKMAKNDPLEIPLSQKKIIDDKKCFKNIITGLDLLYLWTRLPPTGPLIQPHPSAPNFVSYI